jgi:hypothetical protein
MQDREWTETSPVRKDRWQEYHRLTSVFWDQLVYARTATFLLRELASFPMAKLLAWNKQVFLQVVSRALYDGAVLAVTKLVTDKGKTKLTIHRLRKRVAEMLNPDTPEDLVKKLEAELEDVELDAVLSRIKALRDRWVAHLSKEDLIGNRPVPMVAIRELERAVSGAESLYAPILLGESASFLVMDYDPEIRAANPPEATDYEIILNALARESYNLNLPSNPGAWRAYRKRLNDTDLEAFNYWRQRVGLPQVT